MPKHNEKNVNALSEEKLINVSGGIQKLSAEQIDNILKKDLARDNGGR